eukprot:77581-Pleurochrysis_carterae.AAC.3
MELVLTEENAKQVLDDCQTTLAAVFGNNDEAAVRGCITLLHENVDQFMTCSTYWPLCLATTTKQR